MTTERASPRYAGIDVWEPADILESLIEGQFAAVAAVRAALPEIEAAAIAMQKRLRERGRLVYAGAGTSGRMGVQDGAELIPTFSWPEDRLLLLIAGGKDALLQSVEAAEDEVEQAVALVTRHEINAADVLIAVAASGTTPFTMTCLREARKRGALTVGIANNRDTPILHESHHAILLNTGSEPIAGSTRMKAGTAQKLVLNALSTAVMVRLGKVCSNLMVEMPATNAKLRRRAAVMVELLAEVDPAAAAAALDVAGGEVKTAVLVARGQSADEARQALEAAGGNLRQALARAALPPPRVGGG